MSKELISDLFDPDHACVYKKTTTHDLGLQAELIHTRSACKVLSESLISLQKN
jgi:hypothetical protein